MIEAIAVSGILYFFFASPAPPQHITTSETVVDSLPAYNRLFNLQCAAVSESKWPAFLAWPFEFSIRPMSLSNPQLVVDCQ